MADTQRDPGDVNARDAWDVQEKIRGPEGNSGEDPRAGEPGRGAAEGRDVPPTQRPEQDSPWKGGG